MRTRLILIIGYVSTLFFSFAQAGESIENKRIKNLSDSERIQQSYLTSAKRTGLAGIAALNVVTVMDFKKFRIADLRDIEFFTKHKMEESLKIASKDLKITNSVLRMNVALAAVNGVLIHKELNDSAIDYYKHHYRGKTLLTPAAQGLVKMFNSSGDKSNVKAVGFHSVR